MLPPYGWAVNPRSKCFCPLAMPQYLFSFACRIVDTLANGVDNGHGKGPLDDMGGTVDSSLGQGEQLFYDSRVIHSMYWTRGSIGVLLGVDTTSEYWIDAKRARGVADDA